MELGCEKMKFSQRGICKLNNIPIVFTFDKNFILPASIAIKSLIDYKLATTEYEVWVLCSNIDAKTKRAFEKITKINWLDVDDNIFKNYPVSDTWNSSVYYRLLIPQLLPQYDKVIYSDVDVLFKSDLSEVFKQNIEDNYWAGVIAEKNTSETICHRYFPENKNENIYMSGFMVINSAKMRQDKITDKLFDNVKVFGNRLKFFDLDLLNITCNKISTVPFEYCVLENIYDEENIKNAPEYPWLSKVYSDEILLNAKKNPKIIHYAGGNEKIWNKKTKDIPQYYFEYIKNSPFYKMEYYFPTIKMVVKKLTYKILAKISLNRETRKIYKNKLSEYHY